MSHFFRTICQAGLIFTAAFFAATSVAHPPTPPWEECACEDDQFTITLVTTHPDDEIHLVPEKDFYRRGEAVVVVSTPGPGRHFQEWKTGTAFTSQSALGFTGSVNQLEYLYITDNITIEAVTESSERVLKVYYNANEGDVTTSSHDGVYTNSGTFRILTVTPQHDEVISLQAEGVPGRPHIRWTPHLSDHFGSRYDSDINIKMDQLAHHTTHLRVWFDPEPLIPPPPPYQMNFHVTGHHLTVTGNEVDIFTSADGTWTGVLHTGPYLMPQATSSSAFAYTLVPRHPFAYKHMVIQSGGNTYISGSLSNSHVDGGTYEVVMTPSVSLEIEVEGGGVVTSQDFQALWAPSRLTSGSNIVDLAATPCEGYSLSHWEYDAGHGWESPGQGDFTAENALRLYMTWKEGDGIRLKEGEEVMKVRAVFEPEGTVRVILIRGWDWKGVGADQYPDLTVPCSEGDSLVGGMDELLAKIPNMIGCNVVEKRIYRENCVTAKNVVGEAGTGLVLDDIVDAYLNEGVRKFALIGYSRGGGSVADLADRLANPEPLDPHYPPGTLSELALVFTGYIDAVTTGELFYWGALDWSPEIRRPSDTLRHANLFQEFQSVLCRPGNLFRGDYTEGAPNTPNRNINSPPNPFGATCICRLRHLEVDSCIVTHEVMLNGLDVALGYQSYKLFPNAYCTSDGSGMIMRCVTTCDPCEVCDTCDD